MDSCKSRSCLIIFSLSVLKERNSWKFGYQIEAGVHNRRGRKWGYCDKYMPAVRASAISREYEAIIFVIINGGILERACALHRAHVSYVDR